VTTSSDASDGRFLACRAGFYDPAVFEPAAT
jgi:Starvation-inducible outer membrane lipoprotein